MAKRCVAGMSSAFTRQGNPQARAAVAVALQRSGSSVLQALHKGSKGATTPLLAELDGGALEQYTLQLTQELARLGSKDGHRGNNHDQEASQEASQEALEGSWVVEQLYAVTRMQTADEQHVMHVLQLLAANAAAVVTAPTVRVLCCLVLCVVCWCCFIIGMALK